MRRKLVVALLCAAFLPAFTTSASAADIVEIIAANPKLTLFAAAIKSAGLTDKLKEKGPFTVFAPTDEAFKRLPGKALDNLMKAENHEQLVKLVSYHIVPARVAAKDMDGKMYNTKTILGKEIEIDADDPGEGIRINKVKVTATDQIADNGVVHEIGRVLLP
ncbi:MAG: fasciclin domain-containing protein [Reyranella sp.]|uniref:fasciclin domain-containing protein n=1 Tax=Reyranella sp. TaxID=1929291 RepID=UPI001ACEB9BD|nr:fasciclin domain-containing protein [Reyranella sp.]MBN9086303.1 fasciclin domain-containing protein [Reyranella sp.]